LQHSPEMQRASEEKLMNLGFSHFFAAASTRKLSTDTIVQWTLDAASGVIVNDRNVSMSILTHSR